VADTWYFTDDGIKLSLGKITGQDGSTPLGSSVLRLYKNNPSPAPSKATVLGDLTQCTFAGYSGQTLSSSNWAAATVTAHVASSLYSFNVDFTRSSTGTPEDVYGAYLTDSTNTQLLGVCLFAGGPYVVEFSGDKVTVKPRWTVESKN